MTCHRVLLVEDDSALAQVLCHNLTHEGFEVTCVTDGTAAVEAVQKSVPDIVLLDISLPGRDGYELCTRWRQQARFPIIIVSSRDRLDDKLRGLNEGADDYVAKPFVIEELVVRMHAVLRRTRPTVERIMLGPCMIDFANLRASRDGVFIDLSEQEFRLLRYLAERANRVVPRDELLRQVWGYFDPPFTRSVDKAILRLRKKVEEDPHDPAFLLTAHGDGYRLVLHPGQFERVRLT